MREEARTTPDDLKHMLGRQSYPTWMRAAYADVASRLARVEASIEDLGASACICSASTPSVGCAPSASCLVKRCKRVC